MKTDNQPLTNSAPGPYPARKYVWRVALGGLLLLALELSLFVVADFSLRFPFQYLDKILTFLFWCLLVFLAVNLMVAMSVIWLPAWQEPKPLKAATLALGTCLLAPVLLLAAVVLEASTTKPPYNFNWGLSVSILQFMLLILSMILGFVGLGWGRADDRTGNLPNARAGVAERLSTNALGLCALFMIPTCCLLVVTSRFPGF